MVCACVSVQGFIGHLAIISAEDRRAKEEETVGENPKSMF